MKHISQVQETKVVLDEKMEIDISVRKRKEIKKKYMEYVARKNVYGK